VQTNAPSLPL